MSSCPCCTASTSAQPPRLSLMLGRALTASSMSTMACAQAGSARGSSRANRRSGEERQADGLRQLLSQLAASGRSPLVSRAWLMMGWAGQSRRTDSGARTPTPHQRAHLLSVGAGQHERGPHVVVCSVRVLALLQHELHALRLPLAGCAQELTHPCLGRLRPREHTAGHSAATTTPPPAAQAESRHAIDACAGCAPRGPHSRRPTPSAPPSPAPHGASPAF